MGLLKKSSSELDSKTQNVTLAMVQRLMNLKYFLSFKLLIKGLLGLYATVKFFSIIWTIL